jgi:hydrogenase expression/formation protein HypE
MNVIRMAHGAGGRMMHELIERVFLSAFGNSVSAQGDDSAVFDSPGTRLAFTTDSFVVDPLFFPGGDVGRIAVCGTVNDLAVCGAEPKHLSAGFILEEGFPIDDLERIVRSMKQAADEAGVSIVTGDTKVVPSGKADGIFITTAGVGAVPEGVQVSGSSAKSGDAVILNGPIGLHGIAVLSARGDFGFSAAVRSDAAPLNHLTSAMLQAGTVHAMRDATRGGLASTLNEIARQSSVEIVIEEAAVPIPEGVQAACELLGLDPLAVANEGVLAAFVPMSDSEHVLAAMRKTIYGLESRVIGYVQEGRPGRVLMKTKFGSHRIIDMQSGELLPRIC